jgi:hypothetical protein
MASGSGALHPDLVVSEGAAGEMSVSTGRPGGEGAMVEREIYGGTLAGGYARPTAGKKAPERRKTERGSRAECFIFRFQQERGEGIRSPRLWTKKSDGIAGWDKILAHRFSLARARTCPS